MASTNFRIRMDADRTYSELLDKGIKKIQKFGRVQRIPNAQVHDLLLRFVNTMAMVANQRDATATKITQAYYALINPYLNQYQENKPEREYFY